MHTLGIVFLSLFFAIVFFIAFCLWVAVQIAKKDDKKYYTPDSDCDSDWDF
jgi:hypothetical protein